MVYGQKSQKMIPMSALTRCAGLPNGQKHRGSVLIKRLSKSLPRNQRLNAARMYQPTIQLPKLLLTLHQTEVVWLGLVRELINLTKYLSCLFTILAISA
jgi:hypothetical protein